MDLTVISKKTGVEYNRGFGGSTNVSTILSHEDAIEALLEAASDTLRELSPGFYPVILDPEAAGLFAHEVVGHCMEADVWMESKSLQEFLQHRRQVCSAPVHIIDDPLYENGVGCYTFDDEGTKTQKTYLIKNGQVNSLMHSLSTAEKLSSEPTGNARAISPIHPPLVRMSNTYWLPGQATKGELFDQVSKGIYVVGSRNSTGGENFSISGRETYLIEDGVVSHQLLPCSIYGGIEYALKSVSGISSDFMFFGGGNGGCGKNGQWPLPVGSGGPHVMMDTLFVK